MALSIMTRDERSQKLLYFLLAPVTVKEVITDTISHRLLADTKTPSKILHESPSRRQPLNLLSHTSATAIFLPRALSDFLFSLEPGNTIISNSILSHNCTHYSSDVFTVFRHCWMGKFIYSFAVFRESFRGTWDAHVFPCDLHRSKDRRDEAMRNNFEKMKLYGSALNMYATSPAPGFASGHPRNSRKRSGSFIQEEPLVPGSRPLHFVESLGSYLGRVSCAILFDYGFRRLL